MQFIKETFFSTILALGYEPTRKEQIKISKVDNYVTGEHFIGADGMHYVKWRGQSDGFNGDAKKPELMTDLNAKLIYGKNAIWNGKEVVVAEGKKETMYSKEFVDGLYEERNHLMFLAAALADQQGYETGIRKSDDKDADEWPVLYVELPTGEVANHIPRKEMPKNRFDVRAKPYEPYDLKTKHARIRAFVDKE